MRLGWLHLLGSTLGYCYRSDCTQDTPTEDDLTQRPVVLGGSCFRFSRWRGVHSEPCTGPFEVPRWPGHRAATVYGPLWPKGLFSLSQKVHSPKPGPGVVAMGRDVMFYHFEKHLCFLVSCEWALCI